MSELARGAAVAPGDDLRNAVSMDAFEQIAARLFEVQGYWTRIGYGVELTKEQNVAVGKQPRPLPQLDVIAYKPATKELLGIKCKSFLDFPETMHARFHGEEDTTRDIYKLFNRSTRAAARTSGNFRGSGNPADETLYVL